MGRPKALLPWRGRALVETVVATLSEVVSEVVVVSSDAFELPRLAATVVRDREPGLGPLAGIREGLHTVGSGLAFVASTDAPHLSTRFVASMLSFERAAALEQDGHVQTLCAVYDAAHAADADALITEGRMRPLFLLEASGFRLVQPDEVEDPDCIRGFNRPEEYLAAIRAGGSGEGAVLELFGSAARLAGRDRIDVPVGTLGEVLGHAEPELVVCRTGEIAPPYRVTLNGRDLVRDPGLPIGPGDRVTVLDADAGS